ncbi:MAG TPA: hypothetical protein VG965_02210 [Patescibacteria group bacterium]|nr:hypothetical protein [Patescibacteria group bacterium]
MKKIFVVFLAGVAVLAVGVGAAVAFNSKSSEYVAVCDQIPNMMVNLDPDGVVKPLQKDIAFVPAPANAGKLAKFLGPWQGSYGTDLTPDANVVSAVIVTSVTSDTVNVTDVFGTVVHTQQFSLDDGKLVFTNNLLGGIVQTKTLSLSPDGKTISETWDTKYPNGVKSKEGAFHLTAARCKMPALTSDHTDQ